jgi:hypothetical protein
VFMYWICVEFYSTVWYDFLRSWEVPFVGTQCFFWESCGSGGGSARPFLAGVDLGRWMVGLLVLRTGSEDGVRGIGVEVDLDLDVVAVGGVGGLYYGDFGLEV